MTRNDDKRCLQRAFAVLFSVLVAVGYTDSAMTSSASDDPNLIQVDGVYFIYWSLAFSDWSKQFSSEQEANEKLTNFSVTFATNSHSIFVSFLAKPGTKPLGLKGGRSEIGIEMTYEIDLKKRVILNRSFFR